MSDWLKCDRCDKPMPPEMWNRRRGKDDFIYDETTESPFPISFHQVSDGITLIFEGGYGMFTDAITKEQQEKYELNICHDCVVALLEFFPEHIRQRFDGGHPAYNDVPREERCCRYAWTMSDVAPERITGDSTGD